MSDHNVRDAEIAAAIDAALLLRRRQFDGQPAAWHVLCEAAHVATLGEAARTRFIERVASSRGADVALRLLLKAESIRATVIQALQAGEAQAMEPFAGCAAHAVRRPAGALLH